MENGSVFAIEQGSYSDYHVVGIYSTKEAADKVCETINSAEPGSYDRASVTEWPLNPGLAEINQGLMIWNVLMRRDGHVEKVSEGKRPTSYDISDEDRVRVWRRSQAAAYQGTNTPDVLDATVWAEDATHAVKITNERRGQMIATNQW